MSIIEKHIQLLERLSQENESEKEGLIEISLFLSQFSQLVKPFAIPTVESAPLIISSSGPKGSFDMSSVIQNNPSADKTEELSLIQQKFNQTIQAVKQEQTPLVQPKSLTESIQEQLAPKSSNSQDLTSSIQSQLTPQDNLTLQLQQQLSSQPQSPLKVEDEPSLLNKLKLQLSNQISSQPLLQSSGLVHKVPIHNYLQNGEEISLKKNEMIEMDIERP